MVCLQIDQPELHSLVLLSDGLSITFHLLFIPLLQWHEDGEYADGWYRVLLFCCRCVD